MIICVCHRVSDRDIARAAASGCRSFAEVQDELRVGTACGACAGFAEDVFAQHCGGCSGARCHAAGGAPAAPALAAA